MKKNKKALILQVALRGLRKRKKGRKKNPKIKNYSLLLLFFYYYYFVSYFLVFPLLPPACGIFKLVFSKYCDAAIASCI